MEQEQAYEPRTSVQPGLATAGRVIGPVLELLEDVAAYEDRDDAPTGGISKTSS